MNSPAMEEAKPVKKVAKKAGKKAAKPRASRGGLAKE
jgi:hypothetical protein